MKFIFIILHFVSFILIAQPKWESDQKSKKNVQIFKETQSANFQTTESLQKGDWMYEISHRFLPPIKDGINKLYGLDGPARIRFALGYGISDELQINFGRSNNIDNYEIQLKHLIYEFENQNFPSELSLLGGIVLNTEIGKELKRSKTDSKNFQFYAQVIFNTMLYNNKLGVGIVPSYLNNSFIYAEERQYTFTLGSYIKYYLNSMWSFWFEYNAIVSGYQGIIKLDEIGKSYNTISFGLGIDTGGHIFNLFVSNNSRLNSSQYLVGAENSTKDNMWKLGFGILRYF